MVALAALQPGSPGVESAREELHLAKVEREYSL
jgi:hypothetical protein